MFASPSHDSDNTPSGTAVAKSRALRDRIHERIMRRLSDRVHGLEVQVRGNRVVLRGRCATYYSKQLAQQAALGAIEDERLVNAIEVGVVG